MAASPHHYRPNLDDLTFNLFDVHGLAGLLCRWGFDEDTARDLLVELARFGSS